jgi:hypothetical protein
MKKIFIIYQLVASLILFVFYLCLFVIYRNLFGGKIIFYEGVIVGLILFCCSLCLSLFYQKISKKTSVDVFRASILPAILFYLLFISLIPTIIDRSVSITVLGKLYKENPRGATLDELQDHFLNAYVNENKAVNIRLMEQQASGTVVLINDRYFITRKGMYTVEALRTIGQLFKVDTSYINAEVPKSNNDLVRKIN